LPEWLVERGVGETRMALVERGEIVEVRIRLDGVVPAGSCIRAVLKKAGIPALAADAVHEYLLPKGAPGATEGEAIAIEITREAIPGPEPWKRPLARLASAVETFPEVGKTLPFPAPTDRLGKCGWGDLLDEARSGIVRFTGGELRIFVTPAMTFIDVDGTLPPAELAVAGARAAARAIRRHGIGGSIGIDLPTVGRKAQRQAAAEAIDASLPQPFERTTVNGFGFVQIVRPRTHASLFELAADRATFEARALLRSAALERPGPKRLVAHPAVTAILEAKPDWVGALARQAGGAVTLRVEASIPIHGGYAEAS
jgi:ribonuclease G